MKIILELKGIVIEGSTSKEKSDELDVQVNHPRKAFVCAEFNGETIFFPPNAFVRVSAEDDHKDQYTPPQPIGPRTVTAVYSDLPTDFEDVSDLAIFTDTGKAWEHLENVFKSKGRIHLLPSNLVALRIQFGKR